VFSEVSGFFDMLSRFHFDTVPTGPVTVPFTVNTVFTGSQDGKTVFGAIVKGSGTLVFDGPKVVRTDPLTVFTFDTLKMSFTGQADAVPEPATWGLISGSLLGMGCVALRRRKAQSFDLLKT
jgi:hypothetical protein